VALRELVVARLPQVGGSADIVPPNPVAEATAATVGESEQAAITALGLEELVVKAQEIGGELEQISMDLLGERDKFQQWKKENVRRRHNFIPAILELTKQLASRGLLSDLITKGTAKAQQRAAAKKEKEAAKK